MPDLDSQLVLLINKYTGLCSTSYYSSNISAEISLFQETEIRFDTTYWSSACQTIGNWDGVLTSIIGSKINGHYECLIPVRNNSDDISIRSISALEARSGRTYG